MQARLVTHPTLGPPITDWRRDRAIRRSAKVLATVAVAAAMAGARRSVERSRLFQMRWRRIVGAASPANTKAYVMMRAVNPLRDVVA